MKLVEVSNAFEKALKHLLGTSSGAMTATNHPQLLDLSHKYQLAIVTDIRCDQDDVSFEPCDEVQTKFAVDLLTSQLNIYAPEIIHKSRIERIVVGSGLRSGGHKIQGLAQMGLLVVDTIFLEIGGSSHDWEYTRLAFHHELFHAIDYHDDLCHYVDLEWRSLNEPSFDYDYSLFKGYNEKCERPGFISTYSMSCAWEEKAEVYAHLMVDYVAMQKRAEQDAVLSRKITRMKQLLHRFSPLYDEQFWQQIQSRSLPNHGRTRRQWLKMQEILQQEHDRLSGTGLPLSIWTAQENGKSVWKLQRHGSHGAQAAPVKTLYTFNKLTSLLLKLAVKETITRELSQQGTVVFAHVSSTMLAQLEL